MPKIYTVPVGSINDHISNIIANSDYVLGHVCTKDSFKSYNATFQFYQEYAIQDPELITAVLSSTFKFNYGLFNKHKVVKVWRTFSIGYRYTVYEEDISHNLWDIFEKRIRHIKNFNAHIAYHDLDTLASMHG